MQSLPRGRHTPGPSRRAWARARSRRRAAAIGFTWLIVLGVVSALGAAALTHGRSQKQAAQLSSSDGNGPMLGSSVYSSSDLAKDTAEFGQMPIVRVYYPGLPSANAWTTGLPALNKSTIIVSFKALPTTILSGADDAALSHFFDTAPRSHPIYYSYYHEPEDNITAGQFTLADYKAAWAHVVALANAAHNPDLHSTLILMEWDLVKASHRDWKSYLPGGGIISTLGWDAYPVGSATDTDPQLTPPAQFMGPAIAASESVGLPYGFAEFALSTPTGRTAWLKEVGNYLMGSGALFGTYFNGNAEYPTARLTSAADTGMWRSFVARSDTGAPTTPVTPTPAPSSPPVTPTPAPSSPPAAPMPAPSSPGLGITGLTLSPSTLSPNGSNHTAITFNLTKAADVTLCVLNSNGTVVRELYRPGHAAGTATIQYYGYNGAGRRVPSGRYTVLIVASNAGGNATTEGTLTINDP